MVQQLCPDGVPSKTLGQIGRLVRGNGMPRAAFTDTGVGAIHYGQIYTYYGAWTTTTISFVSLATAARLAKVDPGDLIIANTSENLEDVCKAVAWLGTSQIVTGGHATVLKHSMNPKYLSYYLQTPGFAVQKERLANGAKVIDVSARSLETVRIPVPPLEVQDAIVRVLDLFQALEATLVAELEGRRRQFAHYRDSLMAFPSAGIGRTPMGELGHFVRGRRFTKDDVVKSGIPSIHYGEIYTRYGVATSTTVSQVRLDLAGHLRYAQPGDVVIASVGETVEDVAKAVAWLGDGPVAIHDDTFAFRSDMNPKFVAYWLQTAAFHAQKNQYVARAKVKRIGGAGLAKIDIPVPPIDDQARIVAILDKFDALLSDPLLGIPAEIEARRAQFRYYRDKLLTFDEAAA